MHRHCEVWLPKKKDYVKEVTKTLRPYNEDYARGEGFWDWWVIGGRWSGDHMWMQLRHKFPEKVERFWGEFKKQKLGWVGGENSEDVQREKSRKLFKEIFPKVTGVPLVYRNSYKEDGEVDDIMSLKQIHLDTFDCATLIITPENKKDKIRIYHSDFGDSMNKEAIELLRKKKGRGFLLTIDYHN